MKEEGGSASKAGATADVPLPNSSARKTLLDPYHDLASSIFDMADTPEMENTFLDAAKEGNYAKIESLLMRRNETIFSLDVRDKKTGNTALVWAAQRGHPKIVDLLLRYGADVTLRNFDCQTAVEVASPQIQQLLLTSAGIGGPHRNLRQASWQGDSNLVQKILEETQVDINCRNDEGLTPLLLLTRDVMLFEKIGSKLTADRPYDPHQVIEQLLSHRADPNAEDEEGKTALHYVAASKAKIASQLVTKLLEDGSDIESRDRRCFTPIHCASQSGNVDVVLSLLDGGCEANARGYAGTTPLHISAINGHDQVACALLRKGADVMLYDDSGLTPVDVAKTKKVKATLKHAWTEATQHREPRNLAPVREGSTRSLRGKNSRHTGEVVFDSLVSSSMNLESARLKPKHTREIGLLN
ncbi:hypothetical protein CAPTEDRAFT_194722 [Capitella teleta]|uniref:Uncharacterized protein n=1 Tax=Capitella teleta TaxID=283909 RepID=R7VBP0_CAPTE|nr:hypothetical protein CAPTEDRAFT_194722 [Capitella teleta]|eukprot:ELU16238.1 hypothetical protein CAPTEDRAFT_194722 [Capitella teleta]